MWLFFSFSKMKMISTSIIFSSLKRLILTFFVQIIFIFNFILLFAHHLRLEPFSFKKATLVLFLSNITFIRVLNALIRQIFRAILRCVVFFFKIA